jgi:hypothetical protein
MVRLLNGESTADCLMIESKVVPKTPVANSGADGALWDPVPWSGDVCGSMGVEWKA